MGAGQFKCPSETVHGDFPTVCVMACPSTYERRETAGGSRCVNKANPTVNVDLVRVAAVDRTPRPGGAPPSEVFTIADLKTWDAGAHKRFHDEQTRFDTAIDRANLKVTHAQKLSAASQAVLDANGGDPDANINYALLSLPVDATEAEKAEVYTDIISKDVDVYIDQFQFLNNQVLQQQQTLDLVNNVKDNIGTVKDDMAYSVGTFNKQISDIRNQININRKMQAQATDYGKWMGIGLNVLIVLALLFLLFTVGRRAMRGVTVPTSVAARPVNPGDGGDFMGAFAKYIASQQATVK